MNLETIPHAYTTFLLFVCEAPLTDRHAGSEFSCAVPNLGVPNPKILEQKFGRVNAIGGPKSMGPRAKI